MRRIHGMEMVDWRSFGWQREGAIRQRQRHGHTNLAAGTSSADSGQIDSWRSDMFSFAASHNPKRIKNRIGFGL